MTTAEKIVNPSDIAKVYRGRYSYLLVLEEDTAPTADIAAIQVKVKGTGGFEHSLPQPPTPSTTPSGFWAGGTRSTPSKPSRSYER